MKYEDLKKKAEKIQENARRLYLAGKISLVDVRKELKRSKKIIDYIANEA